MPPIDPHYTAPSELLAYQYGNGPKQLNASPMSVIVAAGPYTVESDLDYEPLDDFLSLVKEEKPDVLIMVSSRSLTNDCPLQMANPLTDSVLDVSARPFHRRVPPPNRCGRRRRVPGRTVPISNLEQTRLTPRCLAKNSSTPDSPWSGLNERSCSVPSSSFQERRFGFTKGQSTDLHSSIVEPFQAYVIVRL